MTDRVFYPKDSSYTRADLIELVNDVCDNNDLDFECRQSDLANSQCQRLTDELLNIERRVLLNSSHTEFDDVADDIADERDEFLVRFIKNNLID